MPALVFDLEGSSIPCYLALVGRLLDQCGMLKHFPQSRCIFISPWSREKYQSYQNIDRRRYLVWLSWLIFISTWRELMVSLLNYWMLGFTKVQAQEFPMQGQGRPSLNLHQEWMFGKSHCNEAFFTFYIHIWYIWKVTGMFKSHGKTQTVSELEIHAPGWMFSMPFSPSLGWIEINVSKHLRRTTNLTLTRL